MRGHRRLPAQGRLQGGSDGSPIAQSGPVIEVEHPDWHGGMMMGMHGCSGVTHCGRWVKVKPSRKHGWVTRLVCILEPRHPLPHQSVNGAKWTVKREG